MLPERSVTPTATSFQTAAQAATQGSITHSEESVTSKMPWKSRVAVIDKQACIPFPITAKTDYFVCFSSYDETVLIHWNTSLFQDDHAPIYRAQIFTEWFEEYEIHANRMLRPSQSADLKKTEHLTFLATAESMPKRRWPKRQFCVVLSFIFVPRL